MSNEFNVKKIKESIYELDLSKIKDAPLDEELYKEEFLDLLKFNDPKRNLSVIPTMNAPQTSISYHRDFIKANEKWAPDIVEFKLSIFGLKKGSWYRISAESCSAASFSVVTDDRSFTVRNSIGDTVIDEDLRGDGSPRMIQGFFRATSQDIDIFHEIGKVEIHSYKIEEVEFMDESGEGIEIITEYGEAKKELVAWGAFSMKLSPTATSNSGYHILSRLAGEGIEMYFSRQHMLYTIERDARQDTIGESFTDARYLIEINESKLKGMQQNNVIYDRILLEDSVSLKSPNTHKEGFQRYAITKSGRKIEYPSNNNSLIYVSIYKLN